MQKHPVWQLHEAKARFRELFRLVRTEGPQRVVKQHGEAVVIVSIGRKFRWRSRKGTAGGFAVQSARRWAHPPIVEWADHHG